MLVYQELSYEVIGAARNVYVTLGHGFLERAYSDAMCIELRERGISFVQEQPVSIVYHGETLPHGFVADIVVERKIILELKAVKSIEAVHKAQLLNYMKATGIRVGYVINFGAPHFEYERLITG